MAANQLMALSGVAAMVPVNDTAANIPVVTWKSPQAEAAGMAEAIVNSIHARRGDRYLAMVTRRQFGYWLRDKIVELDPELRVEIGFSEGLLESWAARETFLLFCLLVDPDPPTWRAWLGYKNSVTGKEFSAPKRNSAAYLRLLKGAEDEISDTTVEALAAEPRGKPRGAGGLAIWDRARRFIDLRTKFHWGGENAEGFLTAEHVYILGLCREALPGQRRDEYPGTDAEYREEQRRLFCVSITRARKTLVISRALCVGRGPAKQLGLTVTTGSKFWADLKMSPFLHDIMSLLPTAVPGERWSGCVPP